MARLDELGRLTDEESADLHDRVERFRSAWKADGSARPEGYLPPRGSRHRPAVLVRIVAADMERRAAAGQPFRAERYVNHFPEELSTTDMPVELLAAEFRLRHRYTDKPALAEYQRWFPAQFDAMVAHLAQLPPLPAAGAADRTPVAPVNLADDPDVTPSKPRLSTLNDGRKPGTAPPAAQTRMSGLAATGHIDVRPAAAANMNRSGIPSDMLPSDAPYQLIRRIGSGAFGEVFEALAPGGIKVAVKRILRTVDHPASISEKESLEAIKGLSHPFLLKTNAYWVFDDKLVIVMELADGSLTDRIVYHQERGLPGVPPEELIPFFEQTGEALDYLHSRNVSHRDVKPENLLLQQGYAKVADFGLARLHEHAMTVVGNTVGTPAYMAPEMWQQKLSLQSDQYSLAATYVRARLGRHLFDTSVLVDMANSHIHATPNLDPLPEAEQAVLLRALAKKPDDRFPSCLEFAEALRAAVFPPPPPPPPPEPEVRRESRGMLVQAVVVAVTCALAVGLVIWFMIPRLDPAKQEEKPEKPIVVVPPPERRFATYPVGWNSAGEDAVQLGDRYYHRKLMRKIGDQEITAYLIHSTQGSDVAPFYMTEHKITNRVFKKVWYDHDDEVQELTDEGRDFVQGRWLKDKAEKPLAIDGDGADRDLPVSGVTLLEAMLVAELLNGRLPTYQQWQKATGVREERVTSGPAGPVLQIPPQFDKPRLTQAENAELREWKRKQYRDRSLALGLERPLPVHATAASGDVSQWMIRQLVSNGQEWIGEHPTTGARFNLSSLPISEQYVFVAGWSASDSTIEPASVLKKNPFSQYKWTTVEGLGAGFRVVLEPK